MVTLIKEIFKNRLLHHYPTIEILDGNSKKANPFLKEKRGNFVSSCMFIVLPENTKQVVDIVKLCVELNINLVPQGGNTGLVGGCVSDNSSIILNSQKLNKILEIDTNNYSVTVQSGVVLKDLQNYAKKYNLMFPLRLPSEEYCCLGGNLSTNAGGINVLKYGNIRNLTLGLEVVLPNGEVFSDLNKLRKRNIGPPFNNLFIGAEGTLGFITSASLKLVPCPEKTIHCIIKSSSIENTVKSFHYIYRRYSNNISAFEIINSNAITCVLNSHPNTFWPFKHSLQNNIDKQWYAIFSLEIQDKDNYLDNNQRIKDDLRLCPYIKSCYVEDNEKLWELRFLIPNSQKSYGISLKHDISVPISKIDTFIKNILKIINKKYNSSLLPIIFGHLGDGNLHFNISTLDKNLDLLEIKSDVKLLIITNALGLGGTFSAEHGIGLVHKEEFRTYYKNNNYAYLKSINTSLYKDNIFNRDKII